MSSIRIEKNVPLPAASAIPKLPLAEMAVEDSFVVEVKNMKTDRALIRQRLSRWQQSHPPVRFFMRTVSETAVRVFRVPDYEVKK